MRTYPFPFAAVVALAITLPVCAAEKQRPVPGTQNQTKKVWTNEDMDQLRARGLISIVGQEVSPPAVPVATATAASAPLFPAYASRMADPGWYAKQAADLQAELDRREVLLQQERLAISRAADRITQPGVALNQPTYGVTPQAALAVLEAQVGEVQSELNALSDLARQNNISPGLLRS